MALDRQSIEKRDFPIGRRGYEPAAVDAHLADARARGRGAEALAGRPSPRRRPRDAGPRESLASVASAQVQAIVEAAESSAAAIEREAREQAAQIRAGRRARRRSAPATRRSSARRSTSARSTRRPRSCSSASTRWRASSARSSSRCARAPTASTPTSRCCRATWASSTTPPAVRDARAGRRADRRGRRDRRGARGRRPTRRRPSTSGVPLTEPRSRPAPSRPPHARAAGRAPPRDDDDDVEGARLIALNMALNGQSREETDKYLAENFDLSDRAALLDEVYATVEGLSGSAAVGAAVERPRARAASSMPCVAQQARAARVVDEHQLEQARVDARIAEVADRLRVLAERRPGPGGRRAARPARSRRAIAGVERSPAGAAPAPAARGLPRRSRARARRPAIGPDSRSARARARRRRRAARAAGGRRRSIVCPSASAWLVGALERGRRLGR